MLKSIALFVIASLVSVLAIGCMPNADQRSVAFAPRAYPYLPMLGPDQPK